LEVGGKISVRVISMDNLISTIVPAYNVEKDIVRCLDSISSQTYPNIEIIVVDDGSNDRTAGIIDEYSILHRNVRVIHKENGGVTSARLRGVQEASGEWIGFVDGDDEIEPDMYERLMNNARKYGAEISHCGYQMIFNDGRVHNFHNSGVLIQHDKVTALQELLSGSMIEPGLGNKLFQKNLFQKLLHTEVMDTSIKINEDLLMNFYLFREANHTVFEDFCPYHYIVRSSSATRRMLTKNDLYDPVKVREIILGEAPYAVKNEAKQAYIKTCIAICNRIAREKSSGYEGDFLNMQMRIREKKSWFNLLNKKQRVLAQLIIWIPKWYGVVYRFYFTHLSKRPYD